MKKAVRHGEICFLAIDKLPDDLEKESNQKEFLKGSHGNAHTFDNGELYLKDVDENVFGYFKAKDTTLFHVEHGEKKDGKKLREAKLPDGIYELRRQVEIVNEEMKPVID